MRPTSLKEAVDRIIGGESRVDAVSEFLDEFYPSGPSERQRMIGEEPGLTGEAFQDAYVGAVGEHLAGAGGWTSRHGPTTPAGSWTSPISPTTWNSRSQFSCATARLPSVAA